MPSLSIEVDDLTTGASSFGTNTVTVSAGDRIQITGMVTPNPIPNACTSTNTCVDVRIVNAPQTGSIGKIGLFGDGGYLYGPATVPSGVSSFGIQTVFLPTSDSSAVVTVIVQGIQPVPGTATASWTDPPLPNPTTSIQFKVGQEMILHVQVPDGSGPVSVQAVINGTPGTVHPWDINATGFTYHLDFGPAPNQPGNYNVFAIVQFPNGANVHSNTVTATIGSGGITQSDWPLYAGLAVLGVTGLGVAAYSQRKKKKGKKKAD